MKNIKTPVSINDVSKLKILDKILITGYIYAGRDVVLPKLVTLIKKNKLSSLGINLDGSAIFHTAVSPAGVGPTSSNKPEIENSIPALSQAGVKLHLGKGALSESTVEALNANNSIFAIVPPLSALLSEKIIKKKVVAFAEEGVEALHLLKVNSFPAIIAVAHGKSIFKLE